jgi:pimeloyl-ACP methyl ester carboxylesterase
MNAQTLHEAVAVHQFGNITATEKLMRLHNSVWRYTVSGCGNKFLLAILSNTTGHLLALPLAEEFRDAYTTIALSVPPIKVFSQTAEGLKRILECEGAVQCDAIGHSNGGVHIQNLIAQYPGTVEKVVFSHSLTSMDKSDALTINASEVKVYRTMRRMLKVLPASALTFLLARMTFPKLCLSSGKADTRRLIVLCKEDMKRVTKRDFLITADCMEDFLFNHTFSAEPYAASPQNVLIIDSESDRIANPMQRAEMRRLCPGAKAVSLPRGGHLTLLNCREEYFTVLREFWGSLRER